MVQVTSFKIRPVPSISHFNDQAKQPGDLQSYLEAAHDWKNTDIVTLNISSAKGTRGDLSQETHVRFWLDLLRAGNVLTATINIGAEIWGNFGDDSSTALSRNTTEPFFVLQIGTKQLWQVQSANRVLLVAVCFLIEATACNAAALLLHPIPQTAAVSTRPALLKLEPVKQVLKYDKCCHLQTLIDLPDFDHHVASFLIAVNMPDFRARFDQRCATLGKHAAVAIATSIQDRFDHSQHDDLFPGHQRSRRAAIPPCTDRSVCSGRR